MSRTLSFLRFVILIVTVHLVTLDSAAHAAETLKALIVDGQNNHNWQVTTPILRKALQHTGRFDVDVTTSPASGKDLSGFRPVFRDYDVVISNYNGAPWSAATRRDLVEFVKGGGGFVSVHAANNAFPDWPEYNEIIGIGGWGGRNEKSGPYIRLRDGKFKPDNSPGRGGSHGSQHDFVMDVRAPSHPVMKGLPVEWLHAKDELYDRLRGPARNLTVLASAYSDPATRGTGEHEPLIMAIPYAQGRGFHTALGHSPYAMTCVGFQVTLARGTEWAATGYVTLTDVPEDFPTAGAVRTRHLPAAPSADGWVALFNGKDLSGWRQINGTAQYTVEEGIIVGTTTDGSPNSFLCTTNHYGDFELKLEVKVDDELNSGVQIRSNSLRDYREYRVHGYQVEIAVNGTAGLIYDEARRGMWINSEAQQKNPEAQIAFKKGEWNRYRIRCQGNSLRTWVNDVPVSDSTDDMTAAGFIGLQVHGIKRGTGPYQVRWRNLYLKEL